MRYDFPGHSSSGNRDITNGMAKTRVGEVEQGTAQAVRSRQMMSKRIARQTAAILLSVCRGGTRFSIFGLFFCSFAAFRFSSDFVGEKHH